MTLPQVNFRWEFNLGHVFTLCSVLFVGLVGYVNLQRDVADHERRLVGQEAALVVTTSRLNSADVAGAEVRVKLANVEALMTEVRDELRALNGGRR